MEVKAGDGRSTVHLQLLGHSVQVGQAQVDTAHWQHAGLEQVHVPIVVTRHLVGQGGKVDGKDEDTEIKLTSSSSNICMDT